MRGTQFADIDDVFGLRDASVELSSAPSPCHACRVRDLTVCAPLTTDKLTELAEIRSTVELSPGQPLFHEGEPAKHFFNVTEGTLKIYKLLPDGRRQITGFLFPGEFLGLANDETYAYSAEAVSYCALCRFPMDKFRSVLERFPHMERRLLHMARHELEAAQDQMLLLGRKAAAEKLASFLLMLSARAVRRGLADSWISVPMHRLDIADYLGLTIETVSRTFSKLRQEGLIAASPGGKIHLIDRDRLQDISEGG